MSLLVIRAFLRQLRFLGPAAVALAVIEPSAAFASSPHFEVTRLKDAGECPDEGALEEAFSRTVEGAPPALPDKRIARTQFDVQFSRSDSGYTAILRSKELNSERTLATPGNACEPLADAVAIAVAVLLGTVGSEAPPDRSKPAHTSAPQPTRPDAPTDDSSTDEFSRDSGTDDVLRKAVNVLFAEFMGSGISDSINYARFFEDAGVASLRIGFGYTQSSHLPTTNHQFTFPILLELDSSYSGSHNFHFGTGVTGVLRDGPLDLGIANPQNTGFSDNYEYPGFSAFANVVVGYRYLPRKPGITLGLYAMGLFNFNWGTLWAGANAGYAF